MRGRILIVDDCPVNTDILKELLETEYDLATAASGEEALERLTTFNPDLVLLDIMMPGIDGYETCRRIKASPIGDFTQVIFVSGKGASNERLDGFEAGADDYVAKPFNQDELLAKIHVQFRLRKALEDLWRADNQIREFNNQLERLVIDRSADLIATRDLAVFALAKLTESRDPETGEHLERMRRYCQIVAEQLSIEGPYTGEITPKFLSDLYRSSPLHDIGKVGIPDAILLKPGKLTDAEFEIMKRHTVIGAQALEEAAGQSRCGGFLDMATDIARHHHERFDGSGYPDGLAGQNIPLASRIVALGDVFDAMATPRVYKAAIPPNKVRSFILQSSGTQFDPAVVAAFAARYDDFMAILDEEYVHTLHNTSVDMISDTLVVVDS
jgi:putative two-component system response regulator